MPPVRRGEDGARTAPAPIYLEEASKHLLETAAPIVKYLDGPVLLSHILRCIRTCRG
jgi:hypothetical protein